MLSRLPAGEEAAEGEGSRRASLKDVAFVEATSQLSLGELRSLTCAVRNLFPFLWLLTASASA